MRYFGSKGLYAAVTACALLMGLATQLQAVDHWGGEVGVTTYYNGAPYYEGGDYNPDYYSNPNGTLYYYSPNDYQYNDAPDWGWYGGYGNGWYGGYGGWGDGWDHHHGDWDHHDHHDHHGGDHHGGEHHGGEHHGGGGGHHGGGGGHHR